MRYLLLCKLEYIQTIFIYEYFCLYKKAVLRTFYVKLAEKYKII